MSAEEVGRETDNAVNALQRAIATGFRNIKMLTTDTNLAPIRDRPDVQLMLLDLAFPADPFAKGP